MRVFIFFLRKCVHVYAWHGDNPHRNAWDSKKLSTTRIVENDRLSFRFFAVLNFKIVQKDRCNMEMGNGYNCCEN